MTTRAHTWRHWTRREELRLEQLRLEGKTAGELATLLGRTERAIKNRVDQLKIPRGWPVLEHWLQVCGGPHSSCSAAEQLNVKPKTVREYKCRLRKMGFILWPECMNRKHEGKP